MIWNTADTDCRDLFVKGFQPRQQNLLLNNCYGNFVRLICFLQDGHHFSPVMINNSRLTEDYV